VAVKTWIDVNREIARAVEQGILQDRRKDMPRGKIPHTGKTREWRKRKSPADILGHCAHQNGSRNFNNPMATARYHCSQGNHIDRHGNPLPSTVYAIMIPDLDGPAWLTADFEWIMWAQGDDAAGDENRHLFGILVMGGYEEDGFKRSWTKAAPSMNQMDNLARVTDWAGAVFGYGGEGYFGHYHFGKTYCPGRAVRGWTERWREGGPDLMIDTQWQEALLRWNRHVLPKYGADGQWGRESKSALARFQRAHGIRVTAMQDPFTELILLQKYPRMDIPEKRKTQPPLEVDATGWEDEPVTLGGYQVTDVSLVEKPPTEPLPGTSIVPGGPFFNTSDVTPPDTPRGKREVDESEEDEG
jgi:hypothetical protein